MTGTEQSRLLVIRGNSGSGKTALAAAVRHARPDRTVAIVGQDVIRRQILGMGDDVGNSAIDLISMTARHALDHGFDVVVEGILNAERYGDMLRELVADHTGVTRCYLYDLTFDETLRRHATKPNSTDFGETEMRQWWRGLQRIEGVDEALITAEATLAETTSRVIKECWP